jgi:hypothetical protein
MRRLEASAKGLGAERSALCKTVLGFLLISRLREKRFQSVSMRVNYGYM